MEAIEWRRQGDWAKVAGVAVCFAGAMVLGLFKGPTIWGSAPDPSLPDAPPPPVLPGSQSWAGVSTWHLGVLALLGNCFCMALYITLQVQPSFSPCGMRAYVCVEMCLSWGMCMFVCICVCF